MDYAINPSWEVYLIPLFVFAFLFSVLVFALNRSDPDYRSDPTNPRTFAQWLWSALMLDSLPPAPPAPLDPPNAASDLTPPPPVAPLPLAEWLPLVEKVPHLLIIGESNSGKTTLAAALLAARNGHVTILDPKWQPGKWGGAPAIPIDDNGEYREIEYALQALHKELQQRVIALKQGKTRFVPLTIVVEDLPTIITECSTASRFMPRLAQLGRQIEMHLIGLSQAGGIEALVFAKKPDQRLMFGIIHTGMAAVRVCQAATYLPHPAVFGQPGEWLLLDTQHMPRLAARPITPDRWHVVAASPPELVPNGDSSLSTTDPPAPQEDDRRTRPAMPAPRFASRDELIRWLALQGYSIHEIRNLMGGDF